MRAILCTGELLIDLIPESAAPDEAFPLYRPHPGGAPANVAVAAGRLGTPVRFLGTISSDGFGQRLRTTLAENGVDMRFAPEVEAPTALALVTLSATGEREFSIYATGTAYTQLRPQDIAPRVWAGVGICHAGSVSLAADPVRSSQLAALADARQHGILVSFDVNARALIWPSKAALRETMQLVLPHIDVLKLSADEIEYVASPGVPIADPTDAEGLLPLARALLTTGPALVVITLGRRGALLATASAAASVPAAEARVVDTTGAGDAFSGALLSELARLDWLTRQQLGALTSDDLQRLGAFANRVAALCVTRFGGIAAMPYRRELDATP